MQQTTHCDPFLTALLCNPEVCSSAGCKTQHGSSSSSETSSSACACTTKSVSSLGHDARHPAPHMPLPVPQTGAYRGTTGKLATATHRLPECGRAARLCATSISKAARTTCSQAPESCRSLAWPRRKSWVRYSSALGMPRMPSISRKTRRATAAVACGNSFVPLRLSPSSGPNTWTGQVALHSRHQQPLTRRLPSGLFFRLFSATSR